MVLQGIDLSWWEKLKAARFAPRDGGFKLGKLQVDQRHDHRSLLVSCPKM